MTVSQRALASEPASVLEPPQHRRGVFDVVASSAVAVYLISQVASTKVITVGGLSFPGGIVVFPLAFILGDVITEVYGYARARRVTWLGFVAATGMSAVLLLVQWLQPAPSWPHQNAFETVLGFVPRIVAASLVSYGAGELLNSYVLAKMKLMTEGRHLWARTIMSTVAGQLLDTVVFVGMAFGGIVPVSVLIQMTVAAFVVKVAYEILATPLTYVIVARLKAREAIDTFDYHTDFNPFKF